MSRIPHAALLLAPLALSLGACAIPKTAIVPVTTAIDSPPLDTAQEAEIGDTMVKKGQITTYRSITLSNEVSAGDGWISKKLTVRPQTLLATKESRQWTFYYAVDNVEIYDAVLGASPAIGGIAISKEDPAKVRIFASEGAIMYTPGDSPALVHGESYAKGKSGFQQELIYNGRVGDMGKFLYRELSNDLLRGSFSQEVQYDLSEDSMIGFKGLRIEVLEATNQSIRYKVKKSFPDPGF